MALKSTPIEEILIKGCLNGNRRSQKELYDIHSPFLYSISLKYMKDRTLAEDVLQETFIKLFNNLHRYRGDGPFTGWVRRICVNTSLESLRRNKKSNVLAIDIDYDMLLCKAPTGLQRLYEKDLVNSANTLSSGYREVFKLYAVDGYSHKEIAEKFSIMESTSKSQFSRAKSALRKIVTELY